MKSLIASFCCLLLFCFMGCRTERAATSPNAFPSTLEEATTSIIARMNYADRKLVRETPWDELIQFHMGWGMGIRNSFGLWGGNDALLKSCGTEHPDNASMVIIQNVWKTLRREYMPILPTNSLIYIALEETRIGKLTLQTNNLVQVVSVFQKERPTTGVLSKIDFTLSPQLAVKQEYPLISMNLTNICFRKLLDYVTEMTHSDWYVKQDKVIIW